jgi:hypothetical protein
VRWWDLASGMQTDILQVGREVHSAVVEGVEDPIVIAALTRPFLLWDTASGRLDSLPTRAGFRQRLARHPHSDRLAANSDSGIVVRRLNSPPQRLLLPTRGASVPCERCHLHTRRPVGSLRQLGRHRATLAYRHGDRCDRRGCGTGAIPSGTERLEPTTRDGSWRVVSICTDSRVWDGRRIERYCCCDNARVNIRRKACACCRQGSCVDRRR